MKATNVKSAEVVLEHTYGECEVKAYVTISDGTDMMRSSGGVSSGTVVIGGKMVSTFSSSSERHLNVNFVDVDDDVQEVVRMACNKFCKDAREYIAKAVVSVNNYNETDE